MLDDLVTCKICGKKLRSINATHLKTHETTTQSYLKKFPNSLLSSPLMLENRSKSLKGKKRTAETKRKLSESIKKSWQKNPNQGRTGRSLCEESRKLLSKKMTGHEVSVETRKKISETGIGREPWNKGLTKEEDSRLLSVSIKISEWNKEFMTEDKKAQISATLKKKYANGMKIPHAKSGFRKDLNMYFRSTWEANYARLLIFQSQDVVYENTVFSLLDTDGSILSTYTPDFKIGYNEFTEVKGHADSSTEWKCECKRCIRDKNKMHLMSIQYPDINVYILGKKEYKEIAKCFARKIPNWERTSRG